MSSEELQELILLKRSKFLKPYAKFLIILCKYESNPHSTNLMKEVVGGSYINYTKEAVLDGLVAYERGKAPRLTEQGRALCPALLECWAVLKEKQKEIERGREGG